MVGGLLNSPTSSSTWYSIVSYGQLYILYYSFRITFGKMEISMISVRMQNQPILFEKLAQYSCKKSVKISGEKSGNSYFLTLLSTFTGGGY